MPKQVINKDGILEAALSMTREQGFEYVNARSIAKLMGHSVQPIYSYFVNMVDLKEKLYAKCLSFYDDYIYSRIDNQSMLPSMARANVSFAKNEPNMFKFLFLSKLEGLNGFTDIYERMGDKQVSKCLADSLCVSEEKAKRIYIMLIIFTHGISAILATSGAKINDEEISSVIDNAYNAFVLVQETKG